MQASLVHVVAPCLFSWVSKPEASDECPIAHIPSWLLADIPAFLGPEKAILISAGGSYKGEHINPCLQQRAGILGLRKFIGKGDKMATYKYTKILRP